MKPVDIDEYISRQTPWQQEIVKTLRECVHKADPKMIEEIKWGSPYFMHNGAVAWMFCANSWVHFSFLQGALLDASPGLFEPTDNKAMRTIKIRRDETIPTQDIIKLTRQAVANNVAGNKVDFKIPKAGSKIFDLSAEYETFLKENGLLDEYKNRPFYQQEGWIAWIEAAKQPATRAKRRQTMLKELKEGTYMPPQSSN